MLSYNAYLLITKDKGENFGIARLQTDNTLNIRTETFIKKEEKEIIEAKFKAKIQIMLEIGVSGDFNNCRIIIRVESIIVVQKNQVEKLVLIDVKDNAKNNSTRNCTFVVYILPQFAQQKLPLIILLLLNQKNQAITILLFSINKYSSR